MLLKSIELFGFKSFADRSRIEFTDGISALLGPNGCGKSNIVDAIKWVLGEQGTKSLRAERMEDVIFNGTENRKPLNVAEVSLTLTNDDGVLPIDFHEFTVKRRLFRSGESEYFLNNQPVLLRDVRELFYDTGIGKSAYSIMEQGRIDQILSNKPEERRYIFEEAASITKYKIKSQEAERKLERTEENMRQIEGILGEVKRSYDTLKVQADKTVKYRDLRENMFEVEKDLHLIRLRSFEEAKEKKENQLAKKTEERNTMKSRIDSINESVEGDLDTVNTMESHLVEIQKKLYGIELEKSNRERQLRMLTEQVLDAENKIKADSAKGEVYLNKIENIEKEIQEKERRIDEVKTRREEVHLNIVQFQGSIEHTEERIKSNEVSVRELESEIRSAEDDREALQEDHRRLTDSIVSELDTRLKESGFDMEERGRLEDEIEAEFDTMQLLFADVKNSDFEENLKACVRKLVKLFERYKKTIPQFLDDFVAPEGIITQKRRIDEEITVRSSSIEQNREKIKSLRNENASFRIKTDEYRKTLEELKVSEVKMGTQLTGIEDTRRMLQRDVIEQKTNYDDMVREIETTRHKLERARGQIREIESENLQFDADKSKLEKELAELEKEISARNETMKSRESELKNLVAGLGDTQDQLERLQISLTETNSDIRNIYSNFSDKHSRNLEEFESRMYEIQKTNRELREELTALKEQMRALGSVNLMAPEEFEEIKERYTFLTSQLEDLKKARTDLVKVTSEIRQESSKLFLETYDKIKKSFHIMFRRLFGGGRAELRLSEPEKVLESGIEIYAQPPGKKLENIALLSGGERALTAVSLLFATYMVKPSPFCLLDEIDAALDENNVGRFINMLMEFGKSSQFIIVTHNKKTVTGAKNLLGITMEESGISKVVAIRLDESRELEHART